MKIRLHEIELGAHNPGNNSGFYKNVLGLETTVDETDLKVFRSGIPGLDFNMSTHLPSQVVAISYLTDDLQAVMDRCAANGVSFSGPVKSHLGMLSVACKDPDGYIIKINQPTNESPAWLKV